MVKHDWTEPEMTVLQLDVDQMKDLEGLSDAELKMIMEEAGYQFKKKYKASEGYIHRKIADTDVLISIGANIANFNGYIQMNESAVTLWEQLSEPSTLVDLEHALEKKYGISHEQAVEDVIGFMKVLQEHDMVTVE